MPRRRPAVARMSATGSPQTSRFRTRRTVAPIMRRISKKPVRVGFTQTLRTVTSAVRDITAAAIRNAAEEGSPGTDRSRASHSRTGPTADRGAVDAHADPEKAQHALGVVAGALRLGDGGLPGGEEAGEQERGLDLGRGHRRAVAIPESLVPSIASGASVPAARPAMRAPIRRRGSAMRRIGRRRR